MTATRNRWIDVILIGIIVACAVVAVQYYYNQQEDKCVSNPLVYAANYYEEQYGATFQGQGTFILEGTSPIIYFSKDGLDIVEIE